MPADRREDTNQGLLTEFGLSVEAELVWLALLASPNASISEVATGARITEGQVTSALVELADVGVARSHASPTGFVVHEPTITIEMLIARNEREVASQRERLNSIRAIVPDLSQTYARARSASQEADLDVVHTRDEARQRIFLASEATRSEHRHLMRDVTVETVHGAVTVDADSLARGVQQKSIIGTADLADPEVFTALEALHALGEEIRAVPYVPTQMMIMDREVVVVPRIPDDTSRGAIFIRERALVELFVYFFDHMWSTGQPVFSNAHGAGAPTGRAARVLELMAAGVKDETIARTLRIGSRTVRRDIADLKEALGVSSRTEIVAAAARQGWL